MTRNHYTASDAGATDGYAIADEYGVAVVDRAAVAAYVYDRASDIADRLAPLKWGRCVWVCSDGAWGESDRNTSPNTREMSPGEWILIIERTEMNEDGEDYGEDDAREALYQWLLDAEDLSRIGRLYSPSPIVERSRAGRIVEARY